MKPRQDPRWPADQAGTDRPLGLLARWVEEAEAAGALEPRTVTFVTVGTDGKLSARTVALKRLENHALLFIRSLVGLDRQAATDALAGFVNGKALTADQHDFVALVVEHLTANGTMDPGRLYEAPFTKLSPGGPERLFPDTDVDTLIAAIRAVDDNARPQTAA